MRVLVSAARRHGATAEIAERIGDTLRRALAERYPTADVDLRPPDEVTDVAAYDAIVLGSAVYMGRWLESARDLVHNHAEEFAARPVWLFSSGPIGDPPKPDQDPVDVASAVAVSHAREHKVFAGRLDRQRLGFAEKAVIVALRVADGDFRDWARIEAWATGIAEALATPMAVH